MTQNVVALGSRARGHGPAGQLPAGDNHTEERR
jgi:hypothetical protein